jgi:hypothetical protein
MDKFVDIFQIKIIPQEQKGLPIRMDSKHLLATPELIHQQKKAIHLQKQVVENSMARHKT